MALDASRRDIFLQLAALSAFRWPWSGSSLAALARRRNLFYGSAVRLDQLLLEDDLREVALAQCSVFTPELSLKWTPLEPKEGALDFSPVDELVTFCKAHAKSMRGHTLLWHKSTPDWVEQKLSAGPNWELIRSHFRSVLSRYGDVISQWDVINEPIDENANSDGLRENAFYRAFGPEYIEKSLVEAKTILPNSVLMINEYGFEYDGDARRRYHFLKLIERLRTAGAPLAGVGLQSHLDLSKGELSKPGLTAMLKEFDNFGLEVVITELDVKETDTSKPLKERDLAVANEARRYLEIVLDCPRVSGIVTWGLSDRHSWLSSDADKTAMNRGLPYDEAVRPTRLREAISHSLRRA